jgi:effector-binding domain-containing protein
VALPAVRLRSPASGEMVRTHWPSGTKGAVSYSVTGVDAPGRPTAVIAEKTTWDAFPTLWPGLLDKVWAAVRSTDEITPDRNVMVYKDDVPNVEIGVEVGEPFAAMGRVVSSTLPAGRAARTTHHGRYEDLGAAHEAIIEWCDRHALRRVGPRWEIYGHWREGSADQEVEVYYLVG